jgi:hypothetical protein
VSLAKPFADASGRRNLDRLSGDRLSYDRSPDWDAAESLLEGMSMETLMSRIETLRRGLALVSGYAVVAGVLSIVLSISAMADGEAYGFTRAAIGLVGIAAGLLVLSGKEFGIDGWKALAVWAALQVPVYADTEGGNLFRQLFDLPAAFSTKTTVNGVVTEYSQIGFNLVGVALLIAVFRLRERWNLSQRARAKAVAGTQPDLSVA